MVCLNHPDRAAAFKCNACGKPICEECALEYDGDVYCCENCREKGSASKNRSQYVIENARKTDKKSRIKGFFVFVIILILAAAGYYFYTQHKETIDSKVSEKVGTVSKELKSTGDAFLEVGHKNTPKDSQYRRDREAVVQGK